MNLVQQILLLIISLAGIWVGSGLIINSVDRFSERIKASSFMVSFFLLGLLTSLPEVSIGLNAIVQDDPSVFIGVLLGGTIVLFLLVIPILGILGNGISISHELSDKKLLFYLLYILCPIFLVVDKKVSIFEAGFLVLFYLILLVTTYRERSLKEKALDMLHKDPKLDLVKEIISILVGVIILIVSSNLLVRETEALAISLKISPFFISLLLLSLGTNLPELSIAIRSVYKGKNNIAFGDYVGSAVANSLILGILVIISNGVTVESNLISIFVFIILGITLFYYFARSKQDISRKESLILLLGYFAFVIYEVAFKI